MLLHAFNATFAAFSVQKFLTEHGFIHRDLSTRNILIGDRLNVKIANPGIYIHVPKWQF